MTNRHVGCCVFYWVGMREERQREDAGLWENMVLRKMQKEKRMGKKQKKRSLCFLVMIASIFIMQTMAYSYALEDVSLLANNNILEANSVDENKTIVSVEAFTLGLGYIVMPQYVSFIEGETAGDVLMRFFDNMNGIECDGIQSDGTFHVKKISGQKVRELLAKEIVIPEVVSSYVPNIDINDHSIDSIKRKCGDFNSPNFGNSKVIMFHGVSVGEVNAIEKLVKKTKEVYSDCKIVITTGTNTGQENALKKLGDMADLITYFPFDTPSCVKKFLDKIHPDIILVAETEIWPNIGIECKKRNIKLCIINGRISDRTYNSYRKLKFFFKPLLNNYSGIYTQSTEDLNKFLSLGANPNTSERMNNLKFDITAPTTQSHCSLSSSRNF